MLDDNNTCDKNLHIAKTNFSSIKHLILYSYVNLKDCFPLLSYVPNVRRLSIKCLISSSNYIETCSINLSNLTHISIQFEEFIWILFKNLRVLHLSTNMDDKYFKG
ncbi:unnamed protein product [Adineta steineri]|uniref:Uncharacterized protein n=1 Tax=Adineta steineri TaxID=433720 RepID=A0A813NZI3_9BILA|nr:unnamed protein product [Adineta steineri]CAF1223015.1 unnamed protein product [Adineta steineri]CAF1488678.1 unnamed protein product [Adineta steineri]CAF3653842.1 unnamed protein product [Adineta steineri]